MNPFYRQASFLLSASHIGQAPPDQGHEVAFVGRSNAGKSSALNAICDQKALARTSKTPGRTQLLNFFALDGERRLVDLPGYGYAKVAESVKRDWQNNMGEFLAQRGCLRGIILVMDIRNPLKPFDRQMLDWTGQQGLACHILLTKADKLRQKAAQAQAQRLQTQLHAHSARPSVQPFSGLKKQGVEQVHALLDGWLELAQDPGQTRTR
ncbi:MAG: ribosome biogenesis GTP-binding protein YihA/YsxC [Gammaproteobacteria bacterium SHHR-1]